MISSSISFIENNNADKKELTISDQLTSQLTNFPEQEYLNIRPHWYYPL
jgi:hypothetical protein